MKKTKTVLAEVLTPKLKKNKPDLKRIAGYSATVILCSIVIGAILRLFNWGEFGSAGDFFRGKVIGEIFLIAAIFALMIAVLLVYSMMLKSVHVERNKILPIILSAMILSYLVGILFAQTVSLYAIPACFAPLIIAVLIEKRVGIVANILMSQAFFVTYLLVFGTSAVIDAAASLPASVVSGTLMIIFADRADTRLKFIGMGLIVGLVSALIPILVSLLLSGGGAYEILISGVWGFVANVLSVALFMVLLPFFESLFRVDTIFRISEICSLDFPLLKELAKNAPGTFNHSVAVGNLAELCALAIGENPQLAKAAAYYHDVGKLKNPECFIENQKGYNPHDDFIPEVSVSMITAHTRHGAEMIRKARLPDILASVALEHHGTTPVQYFLYKAQNVTEDTLDRTEFSYPGPKPSSKIAAIIMIVDTVEAATRAMGGPTEDDFRGFVRKLIKSKADLGQFSDCDITYKDLQLIEDVLVAVLPSMYHSRIQYQSK
ncbi:MAG TPA: HDIG domain-containing protein [Candidatus Stercoripulliclostridium merdipullorum]|uniref:HDIG domain-containing protein n=1 Tax=Candidatus Stercoripulliclostridium merdipullorum TaxID=2840952 RepID=A0A9D1NDH1_9FIRM|nr:HDIG domain-containing protein [Candidatus Stercoripulliclostridium merdipullorum]